MGAPTKEDKRASWKAHRESGKPPHEWNPNQGVHGPKDKGRTLRSGAPMRSIKESMISRAEGQRAAENYTAVPRQPAAEIRSSRVYSGPSSGSRRMGDYVSMKLGTKGTVADWGGTINAGPGMPKRFTSGPRNFSPNERNRMAWRTQGSQKDVRRLTTPNPVGRLGASKYLKAKAVAEGLGEGVKKAAKDFKFTRRGILAAGATIGAAGAAAYYANKDK